MSGPPAIYDAFGRRADDNFSGTNTDWIYGPGGVIWGCSGANYGGGCSSNKPSEIYAGSRHVATYANANTYFDYGDWLGTVRTHTKVLNISPNDLCQSLPFGDGLACAGSAPDPMHFTDQILDFEGLTHFLYRDHSTTQGRWIVPDPAGMAATDPTNPQTWNRYAYALNNPLSNIDPDGLDCVYLNDAGNGVDSIDRNSNADECTGPDANGNPNSGYWVDGRVTHITTYTNSNDVSLQGVQADSQGYLSVSTDAYYTNVTASDQSIYVAMGVNVPTGTTDILKAFNKAQLPQIGPISPLDRTVGCAGQAGAGLAKDLTGVSTLKDVATALATGSFQPLVNVETGLDATETVSDVASKVLSGTPGKVLGLFGKAAGRVNTAFSVAKAGAEMTSCMGW